MYPFQRRALIACVSLLMSCMVGAQTRTFKSFTISKKIETKLSESFTQYQTFELEGDNLSRSVESSGFDKILKLNLGNTYQWEFELYPNDLFAEDAIIRVLTENGEEFHPVPRNISFKGNVKGNPQQQVSFLIHDDFIYGHITEGNQRTYISSVSRYVNDAPKNLYMVFDQEDQIEASSGKCGLDEYSEFDLSLHEEHVHEEGEERSVTGLCYDVDLGVVSDYLLFADKGNTVQGAIDHVVAVLTDVETDYETSDFDDALEFEIVEQIVSTCANCDPWTSSTSASDLLGDFTAWSLTGGFNTTVDMGQMWTDRDFDGTTVGLAWSGSNLLCAQAYHVIQDHTTNAAQLRVTASHEMAHNLNADHDVSGTDIMAPTVSSSTTWSATSVSTIDASVDAASVSVPACIVSCVATPCDPITDVSITSITATGFDISWTATTEGDYRLQVRDEETFSIIHTVSLSSSASMTINPAGWGICKRYKVMVENDCGSSVYSAPVSSIVIDDDQGCADFSGDDLVEWGNSHTVNFTNESINASSYSWDFGDSGTSTSPSPSHTYTSAGTYEVSLSVNSGAHTETKTSYVYVLPSGQSLPYTTADGGNMNDDDFGTESKTSGKNSFFEKGVPSNYFTNSTNCWVTNLTGDVPLEDNESWLYTPSFDFSTASAATLSFTLGMEAAFSNAPYGMQVHYSLNDGSTWTKLGTDADASWYNKGPSSAQSLHSAVFTDLMGFLFTSQGVSRSINVDALTGNSSVIFGFVFNAEDGFGSDGFLNGAMIDDVVISATLLPVNLTSFNGSRKGNLVELTWETSSEENNDYFIIEKSNDGRNFEKLEVIEGNGNSTIALDYSCLDKEPFIGVNYYRLTQVDYDGTYEVFDKIVAVDYFGKQKITIQPNPTRGDNIQLIYQIEREGSLAIAIYNAAGQLVKHLDVNTLEARNVFDISLENLSNGVYYIRTIQGDQIQSLRFVKTN